MYRDRIDVMVDDSDEGNPYPDEFEVTNKGLAVNIRNVSGGEMVRGRQIVSGTDFVLEMRQFPTITSDMKLLVKTGPHKDKILEINSVILVERRKGLKTFEQLVMCKESQC